MEGKVQALIRFKGLKESKDQSAVILLPVVIIFYKCIIVFHSVYLPTYTFFMTNEGTVNKHLQDTLTVFKSEENGISERRI